VSDLAVPPPTASVSGYGSGGGGRMYKMAPVRRAERSSDNGAEAAPEPAPVEAEAPTGAAPVSARLLLVTGALSRAAVNAVVQANVRSLAAGIGWHGRARVAFAVDASGKVTSVTLKSGTMTAAALAQLKAKLQSWAFPASGGNTTVMIDLRL